MTTKTTWINTHNKKYKIISNSTTGTIQVYDDKGNLLIEKNNLTKKQIQNIEKHFIKQNTKNHNHTTPSQPSRSYDPMIT